MFSTKEKRAHYTGVANGTIPTKKDSKYSDAEQRAYARGQRDALNDQVVGYVLGKNSNLSAAEKQAFKEKRRADRKAWQDKNAKKKK